MWLPHPDDPHFRLHARLPQFLVISPPKTGSTWLADNLRRHPQLFVPDIKEVKYFSSLFKWVDLGWYAGHFVPAGGRVAGEASPSYAALPLDQIRTLRRLLPDVKLIFLMRDPVSRAWSHAKHAHRYQEANFVAAPVGPATDADWRTNFAHDWPLVNGDYLGHLRRWAAVFPPGQMYVGFYESIAARPAALLRKVFGFLGVDPDVDLSAFPLAERILPGPEGDLPPHLEETLHAVLHDRTADLTGFLRDRFGLEPPPEWQRTLRPSTVTSPGPQPPAFRRDNDDTYLAGVLAQEEAFYSAYRQIHLGYRGYDIVFYRGQLVAAPQALGPGHLPDTRGATLAQLLADGTCLTAATLIELKEQVTHRVLEQTERRVHAAEAAHRATEGELRAVSAEFHAARDHTARQLAHLSAVVTELQRPSRARAFARKIKRAGRRLVGRLRPVGQ